MDSSCQDDNSFQPVDNDMVRLTEGKQFSRLLYPNPVCFLCTPVDTAIGYDDNVMTISWLTAINNEGSLMLSINRRRHSSTYMGRVGKEFCLCVPVMGMEPLLLAVGGTSGKSAGKFEQQTANATSDGSVPGNDDFATNKLERNSPEPFPSKRKKKRLEREALRRGIPNLARRPFYECQPGSDSKKNAGLFYIEGTVARLRCEIYRVIQEDEIDNAHNIVFARILDAYCHCDYWNENKNLFCPKKGGKPFLSFLGSQTFGHVFGPFDFDEN